MNQRRNHRKARRLNRWMKKHPSPTKRHLLIKSQRKRKRRAPLVSVARFSSLLQSRVRRTAYSPANAPSSIWPSLCTRTPQLLSRLRRYNTDHLVLRCTWTRSRRWTVCPPKRRLFLTRRRWLKLNAPLLCTYTRATTLKPHPSFSKRAMHRYQTILCHFSSVEATPCGLRWLKRSARDSSRRASSNAPQC